MEFVLRVGATVTTGKWTTCSCENTVKCVVCPSSPQPLGPGVCMGNNSLDKPAALGTFSLLQVFLPSILSKSYCYHYRPDSNPQNLISMFSCHHTYIDNMYLRVVAIELLIMVYMGNVWEYVGIM